MKLFQSGDQIFIGWGKLMDRTHSPGLLLLSLGNIAQRVPKVHVGGESSGVVTPWWLHSAELPDL